MPRKKSLAVKLVLASTALVLCALIGVGGYIVFRTILKPWVSSLSPVIPDEYKNPGVIVGNNFLSKTNFFQDERLRAVTDIAVRKSEPGGETVIAIAARNGGGLLDEAGQLRSYFQINEPVGRLNITDVDHDGELEYFTRGSLSKPTLFDHEGRLLWSYGTTSALNDDMAAGNIDGDGSVDFVVGLGADGSLHLLDERGRKVWEQPNANAWHIETFDINGDGKSEIIHSNVGGEMVIRDQSGQIIRKLKLPIYFTQFSLCKWPDKNGKVYPLAINEGTIWLFDFDGQVIAQLDAPQGRAGLAKGIAVKFRSDEPEYFAVVVDLGDWDRSILYIYDAHRTLVYQEIVAESSEAIATMPLKDSKAEALLLGGKGKVWQYKAGP
jgi:hypothetical protein